MKRKSNLYENIYNLENIKKAFDEVCSHIHNREKARKIKQYKAMYVSEIYTMLKNREYEVGKYHVFKIYEPKERIVVSQSIKDKVVNHLVSRYILYPAVLPCLIDQNVASRKNMRNKTRSGTCIKISAEMQNKI